MPKKPVNPSNSTGGPATKSAQNQQFRFNTLDFVVSVLDSHSGNFRAHAHAVARYSRVIANQLKLGEAEIDEIVTAAYLHDFNKLIELKQMTYDVMEVLATLNAPESLRQTIHHMHEHYDGTGKPDGLRGEKIPLGSRILAVANLLDEISRGKVDTQVIRRDEAFESLQRRSSKSLDPKLVDLLVRGLKDKYRQYYKEMEARLLVGAEADDQRFELANLLMESGYSVRAAKDEKDCLEALQEFSPHLIVLSSPLYQKLLEACRAADTYVQKPVFLLTAESPPSEVQANDYIPIEDFISTPVDARVLTSKVEQVFERVVKQENQLRETAQFFEKSNSAKKAADIYRELGDLRKAADLYESAQAHAQAAQVYELLHDYPRAARSYEFAGNYVKAAAFYRQEGMYEERARVYEKAGDYYYTAKNRLFAKEIDEALEYFKKVKPSHEKYRKACYFMAKIYMDKRQWREAVEFYEKVVSGEELNADNVRYFYNYALALETVQKTPEALAIYEKIIGVEYNFRDVLKRIEHLREKQHQVEEQTKADQKIIDFNVSSVTWRSRSDQDARYEKVKVLGRGGMGVVYEAIDRVLGRKVALKVLSAAFREDKLVIDTFLREAKATAMLNHVNIVTVYDAGIENNNYFIAMEIIDGQTLKEIIQGKRFSVASVLRLSRQILNGLKYAHSQKIIHRDLTNSNIMLTKDNIVKIMDFGLARLVEHLMSEQSIIGGTPSYMAPEQVQGAPIDHRADIYAMGVNLFELATGRLPFSKGDLGYHHVHTAPPNPNELNPKIPIELNETILKCLAKKPADRFQSVAELMQALKI